MQQLFDGSGNPITLGPKLAQGGEGTVFRLQASSNRVAKIYHDSHLPDQRKTAKLIAMVETRHDQLTKLTAWPLDLLHEGRGGRLRGFVMPLLTGFKEMHLLYTPKTRLTEFPNASWELLVHTAMNTAIVFHAVHSEGHIIGDVNHGNIFVSPQSMVRLIDCDSFQITYQAETYLSELGVPTHTPPELQGKSFKTVRRSTNHDLFGLAVVIFQLLFLGRHPFSGIHLGQGDPPSLETAITEFRFAYGRDAKSRLTQPPPGGLSLHQVTPTVAALFERAFSPTSASGHGRPSAEEWANALKAQLSELQACSANLGHLFLRTNNACPWCAFEIAAGRAMFNLVYRKNSHAALDIEALAAEIATIATPTRPPLPAIVVDGKPDPEIAKVGGGSWLRIQIALVIGIVIAGLGVLPTLQPFELGLFPLAIGASLLIGTRGPRIRLKRKAKADLHAARAHITAIKADWIAERGPEQFHTLKDKLAKSIAQARLLPTKHRNELLQLERGREEMQKRQWLDRHELKDAKIKLIGDGRKSTLQLFNIETALDISPVALAQVPGFGRATIDALVNWRISVERGFRFDPSLRVDPAEIQRIEQAIGAERAKIETELAAGLATLRQHSTITRERYAILARRFSKEIAAEAQAQADFVACR